MLSFCPLPAVQHPDEPPCVSMRDRRENDRGNRDGEHFGRALRHFGGTSALRGQSAMVRSRRPSISDEKWHSMVVSFDRNSFLLK